VEQRLVIGRGVDPAMMIVDLRGQVIAGPVITDHLRWLREWAEDTRPETRAGLGD
jgi:hypothetical protein